MTAGRPSDLIASRIWRLCDVLREDGITYHQYINELSYLLFLKMAEETGSDALLPDDCRWATLRAAKDQEQFNLYMDMLTRLGRADDLVVRNIYANPTSLLRNHHSLNHLVAGIDEIDWHDTTREGLGDIYESLLRHAAEKRSGAGQYFTPRPLIDAIVELSQPQPGMNIQDPALGTAGFLVATHEYLRRVGASGAAPCYVGMELVPENYRLALMNAFVHDMEIDFRLDDALSPAGSQLPPADLILTNPPFGSKRGRGKPTRIDLTFSTPNKQLAFLQHVYRGLRPGGRAAIVLPDNVLFESGLGRDVRSELLDSCRVHTLLRLPTGIFYAHGVKTNVLFFNRPKRKTKRATTRVWVWDMRTNVPPYGRKNPFTREALDAFVKAYGKDPEGRNRRRKRGDDPRWRSFDRAEIEARDDNLDLEWLAKEDEYRADELVDPADILVEISSQLQVAHDEVEALMALLELSTQLEKGA